MDPPLFNPGSILVNNATNKLYGVLVTHLPNQKIIVFRLDKNTHPIFSKFELHDNIMKVGIINEGQYANLKSALLKHYRTHNLTPTEKKMLQPLMNFAFPLGIPEYDPGTELPERDLAAMDLNSKLISGSRFYINTPAKSCYNHLDGKICTLIERNQQGIWARLPSNDSDMTKLGNSLIFLFYRNPDLPTFSGISRITPIIENTTTSADETANSPSKEDNDSNVDIVRETFNKMRYADELTTVMEFNGDKVRVIPKTGKIIMPEIYSGMIYNSHNDTFFAPPEIITPTLSQKLGTSLILGTKSASGLTMEMNGADNDLIYGTPDSQHHHMNEIQPDVRVNADGDLVYEAGWGHDGGVWQGGARGDKVHDDLASEIREIEREESTRAHYSSKFGMDMGMGMEMDTTENSLTEMGNIDDIVSAVDDKPISLRELAEDDFEYRELLHGASILLDRHIEDKHADGKLRRDRAKLGEGGEGGEGGIGVEGVESGQTSEAGETSDVASSRDGGDETDYDEDTFAEVVDDSEVEAGDTFEKVKIMEISELERKYPIQKGDIINYKIEQIPALLRETMLPRIIKEVNMISLLKDKITGKDDGIHFQSDDYKPLLEKYVKGDFSNNFLLPLVINRKKIYLEGGASTGGKDSKITKDDFDQHSNEVIEGYYENIAMINSFLDKKNIAINNDAYTNQIITALNPSTVNEDDQLGILLRLGSGIPSGDMHKLEQDTLVIRYCDKPMKCQSYALTAMNFDYQVNLGPLGRFINLGDENGAVMGGEEEEEHTAASDILQEHPKYEIYYQGDLIRVIGYVRPPLNYFNSKTTTGNVNNILLLDAFQTAKKENKVITVNLKDINDEIIDEEMDQADIAQHPDNFVIFLLPNDIDGNWNYLEEEVSKIIPDVDAIIKLYLEKPSDCTIENIYNVLEKFEYDSHKLPFNIQHKLFEKHSQLIENYEKFNTRMHAHYERYKRELSKGKGGKDGKDGRGEKDSRSENEDDGKFRYITNAIMDDISKFYYEKYENRDISVDADDIRLRWFLTTFDNGRYFYKTLFMNYLKSYQEGTKLESLEIELALLKEKHAITKQSLQSQGAIPGSASAGMGLGLGLGLGSGSASSGGDCSSKFGDPNIIKYPNLARLEEDNGKVAVDSDGNVIMNGDYALVDVDGSKQLYKREIIANVDMWIKEDLATLYKLIQDKKNRCIANPEMKLEKANECLFDMDAIKCEPNFEVDAMKQSLDMERVMSDLQKQVEYIRHLPVLIATLDKEIHLERTVLLSRLNNMKRYWREKETQEAKLEEEIKKTIKRNKPCIHDKVLDHFFRIPGYGEERYQFARAVFRNFLNVEPQFDHDYQRFHSDKMDDNFTYCNICNQKLLCNHFRLGVSFLEDNKPIDFELLVNTFAEEVEGTFHCMACEEFIDNSAVLDIDDFEKGEDGKMMRTREVMEDIPLVEKQKQYIDKLINELVDEEPSMKNEDLQSKIKMFTLLKRVCGLETLSIADEVEMINFLKSYQFTTKNSILLYLASKLGKGNLQLLYKKTEQLYMIYLWCHIAARFLLILQTTTTPYDLVNKSCNTNIIGFPLVDDPAALDGVNFIMCILNQISILEDYTALADLKKEEFLKQLRKQCDEDNYVKSKLAAALNQKSDEIDLIYAFEGYPTNRWKTFAPRLNHIQLGWNPEKILNDANLKEISSKNWHKMIEVGRENAVFYSLSAMRGINYVIESAEKPGITKTISSGCCPYVHGATSSSINRNDNFDYMKYFITRDSSIADNIKNMEKASALMIKLYDVRRVGISNIIFEPLYKPSQMIFQFNTNATLDEIRDIHLKFIDTGINKGYLHVFDRYGRCILSNQLKKDIEQKTYSQKDYKHIEDAITHTNSIDIKAYQPLDSMDITPTNIAKMEIDIINKLIHDLPPLATFSYFRDFLNKIHDNYEVIFPGLTSTMQKNPRGQQAKEQFNINRHLSQLNAQIATEINGLVVKLASTDKLIDKYTRIISNFGNFTALYEEYRETHGIDDGVRFRYTKMEESMHSYMKYLSDIINQIKNRKLSTHTVREKVRPQYRDFLPYSDNVKLFKLIDGFNRQIYNYARTIHSKNIYKVLYPEMVASMLHYLLIISLANMFDSLDNTGVMNQRTQVAEYNFIKNPTKDPAIVDYSNDMQIDLINNDVQLDDDGNPIDLVDNIRMKNSSNLKTISNFIVTYIERVNDNQELYDSLTNSAVNLQITKDKQEKIENTLRSFEWLSKENNEMNRLLVQMKMRLEKVTYGDLHQYLKGQYGDEFLEEEPDEYDGGMDMEGGNDGDTGDMEGGDDGMRRNNAYGMDRYELENELPQVVAYEDLDDGDMDYDYIAVGEDD